MKKRQGPGDVNLEALPGHYIRRLQQIAVAIFLDEAKSHGITPVQYAVLQSVHNLPKADQRTIAGAIGLDTSTTASVIDRLEARGLLTRSTSATDRRVRLLKLTKHGLRLLTEVVPGMQRAQLRILEPLSARQRTEFMKMLSVLVSANNEVSRAPSKIEELA